MTLASPVTVTGVPEPSRRKTPARSTQIPDPPWEKFLSDAEAIDSTGSGVMRDLVLWWIRWPGAKLPKRPEA